MRVSISTLNYCAITNNGSYGVQYGVLNNCSIINNGSSGVERARLANCLVASNTYSGIEYSTAYNCKIIGNRGGGDSAGVSDSYVTNCTIVGQILGAGSSASSLRNCIVYYNRIPSVPSSDAVCCCLQTSVPGAGNFTNPPLFINVTNDFHLQSSSPCINSGNNAFVVATNDLDGGPRIQGGTVDIGAYAYQTPSSTLSYAWAEQYGLALDGTVDFLDLDGTGMNNWQKSVAGLNPTNPASVLTMSSVVTNGTGGLKVSWKSVNTRAYFIQRATDFSAPFPFSTLQSNLLGQPASTSFTDTTATNDGPYFYRVGVQ